jgi:hypothetical protein
LFNARFFDFFIRDLHRTKERRRKLNEFYARIE